MFQNQSNNIQNNQINNMPNNQPIAKPTVQTEFNNTNTSNNQPVKLKRFKYKVKEADGKIIESFFDAENKVEQYPFMNNALYVNKNINLFVQRQDPDDVGHIRHASPFPIDAETNKLTNIKENNYYQEEDIEC